MVSSQRTSANFLRWVSDFAQIEADETTPPKAFPSVDLTQCFPSGFYVWDSSSAVVPKLLYLTRICRRLVLKTGASFCVLCAMLISRERKVWWQRSCCPRACHLQCWPWLQWMLNFYHKMRKALHIWHWWLTHLLLKLLVKEHFQSKWQKPNNK